MTPSIRTFLLINLLLSVTLITSLAIIGNLFLAHKDIQTQLDAQLIRTSLRMEAFFSDYSPSYLKPVDLESVPKEIEPLVMELNSLFRRLQDAFDREKRFTADAAHELRTPLAALNTHTQVALRADTPEERRQALLKVLAGVNRGTHVVQQLLTLSRMVPEAGINEPTKMDMVKEAAEIAAQLAPEAISKNIDLELIAPDKAMMMGNPTAIGILIRNLVDNAIRYSPEDGEIKIKVSELDNHVILEVIDTGPGIPEELRERVFERFYRVVGNKATGSGLGLGIVQQIAKLHDAKIELRTPENGKGLNFTVTFPRKL